MPAIPLAVLLIFSGTTLGFLLGLRVAKVRALPRWQALGVGVLALGWAALYPLSLWLIR